VRLLAPLREAGVVGSRLERLDLLRERVQVLRARLARVGDRLEGLLLLPLLLEPVRVVAPDLRDLLERLRLGVILRERWKSEEREEREDPPGTAYRPARPYSVVLQDVMASGCGPLVRIRGSERTPHHAPMLRGAEREERGTARKPEPFACLAGR